MSFYILTKFGIFLETNLIAGAATSVAGILHRFGIRALPIIAVDWWCYQLLQQTPLVGVGVLPIIAANSFDVATKHFSYRPSILAPCRDLSNLYRKPALIFTDLHWVISAMV